MTPRYNDRGIQTSLKSLVFKIFLIPSESHKRSFSFIILINRCDESIAINGVYMKQM